MTDRERKPVGKPAKKAAEKAEGEAAVLAKIAAMPAPYRAEGERLHALILRSAPHQLLASAWYFTALDDPTEAKLYAIVRKAAR